MLSNIRIVLINTFHPGNIGAAARAMKNMGLRQLYLVNPVAYPHSEAESRAAGAKDVLETAQVVDSLDEAIADCALVIGTSARSRSFPWPMLDARSCAVKALEEAASGPVAIVFGRERMGLHNEELRQCNFHLSIPADPEYPVLNVSAAIQIVCYELYLQAQSGQTGDDEGEPAAMTGIELQESEASAYPTKREMDYFYEHLEQSLKDINFIIPQHEGKVMTKLHRFFNRARPEQQELNMLRGILSALQRNRRD